MIFASRDIVCSMFFFQTKSCAVVLERLDENLLSRYLQKYDFKRTKMVNFVHDVIDKSKSNDAYFKDDSTTHKNPKRNLDKSEMTNNLQKKRKIKPLPSSDDESSTTTLFHRGASASFTSREFPVNEPFDFGRNSKGSETRGTSTNWKETSTLEKKSCEITFESILSSNFKTGNWNNTDNEIEVITEIKKDRGCVCNLKEQVKHIKRLNVENDEDEYDSREDDEDDKSTVIFETSAEDEISALGTKEIECANAKIRNELTANTEMEVVNCLNLAPVKKSEETSCEKKSNACKTEECMKKVCSLVKRLHELYRIISQLQGELPKNVELAVHFSKVIRAEKENFFEEIRKSQNTIIECYENLLVSCGYSAEDMISEISRREFLCVQDVIHIISRCFFLNSPKESFEIQENQNCFPQLRVSDVLRKIIDEYFSNQWARMKENTNNNLAHQRQASFPFEGVGYPFELKQVPPARPVVPEQVIVEEKPEEVTVKTGVFQFYQTHSQNKPKVMTRQRNHRRQSQLSTPDSLTCSTTTEGFYPQNIKPDIPYKFPVNPTVYLSQRKRSNPESSQPENSIYTVKIQNFYIPTYEQQKSTSGRSSTTNIELINVDSSATRCISADSAIQEQNHPQRGLSFPSNLSIGVVNTQRQVLISFEDEPHLTGNPPSFSNRKPQELLVGKEKMLESHEMKSKTQLESVSEELNLPVPQKVAINYQIQAEPSLRRENVSEVTELPKNLNSVQSLGKNLNSDGLEENSESRVYICAHGTCKMPGIRVCEGCQSIIYCSKTCQLKHWVLKHKIECYELAKLRRN